ncbi:MAG: catalase, partial [Actinomycetia bacterium]|nr:catalase [Actinomycetes bacterium]
MAQQKKSRQTSSTTGGRSSTRGPQRRTDFVGDGGELHQVATGSVERMTTAQGIPVRDDQNSLRAGSRGPTLMQDFAMREKIFHFDHERIPERVVHARGYGARGTFTTTDPIPEITRADLFQKKNRKTEVFV